MALKTSIFYEAFLGSRVTAELAQSCGTATEACVRLARVLSGFLPVPYFSAGSWRLL